MCAGSSRAPRCGRADHRLVLVERGVEHHRHAGERRESLDQAVVARIGVARARSAAGPMPSTWVTAGISARFSARIGKTCIMKGTSSSSSNHSRDGLAQDRGRERAEGLAPLDLAVEDVLHVGAARVAEDRAVAERARPPLHAALEPADDLAVARCAAAVRRQSSASSVDALHRAAGGRELAARCARAACAMSLVAEFAVPSRRGPSRATARAAELVPDRDTPRRSRRRRRRPPLHVDPPERRARVDLAVGHRIHARSRRRAQRSSSGSARAARRAGGRRPPRTSPAPSARCRGGAARAARPAARAGPSSASSAGANSVPTDGLAAVPLVVDLLAVMAEVVEVELEGPVVAQPHDLAHRVEVARLAVGREAHHLVLVAVVREAQVLRERLVEDAERVREVDALRRRRSRVPRPTPHAALAKSPKPSTETTDGLVERRDVEGRREVREVVLDAVHLAAERRARKGALRASRRTPARLRLLRSRSSSSAEVGPLRQRVARACARGWRCESWLIATWSTSASAMPASREAVARSPRREARPVLDAAEALLLGRGDEPAVAHQAGRGVAVVGVEAEDVHAGTSRLPTGNYR